MRAGRYGMRLCGSSWPKYSGAGRWSRGAGGQAVGASRSMRQLKLSKRGVNTDAPFDSTLRLTA